MALPKWLEAALLELQLGVAEVPGPASNPRVAAYLQQVGLEGDDEIPWCAAFVGHCLGKGGVAGTGRANARSYLTWGQPCTPRLGAVTVLWRGNPGAATGHVGFFLDSSMESVYLLGGNQSDRVSVAAYPKSKLLATRWPS